MRNIILINVDSAIQTYVFEACAMTKAIDWLQGRFLFCVHTVFTLVYRYIGWANSVDLLLLVWVYTVCLSLDTLPCNKMDLVKKGKCGDELSEYLRVNRV